MPELIKVGMADYQVSKAGTGGIITYGLGSCVAIAMYDSSTKIGGLAHIMLPDSTQARSVENLAKFADTAIKLMLEDMLKLGANKSRLWAKIAGGSQMFSFDKMSEVMKIGERNAVSTRNVLKELGVKIIADDTGGNYGRTVELCLDNGIFKIRTMNKGEKEI